MQKATESAPQYEDPKHKTFRSADALGKRRIVAVGDLHGDLKSTLNVLRMAGVIDKEDKWAGGNNTILVQTGDLIDRGEDTVELLELFPRLIKEAYEVGGRVIQVLGNHEIMNLAGDLRYVSPNEPGFASAAKRALDFSRSGRFGRRLYNVPLVHQVGDTVFAHGGITPEWSAPNLHHINLQAADQLRRYAVGPNSYMRMETPPVLGIEGPAWYRGYAKDPEEIACRTLRQALNIMNVERMVVGHTLQNNGRVLSRCNNRFFVIDVGISQAYMGQQAALEILSGGIVRAIYPTGTETLSRGKGTWGAFKTKLSSIFKS
ncbi:Metallo-dependent phosphatase-like protein [Thamnocephalis sphaerospora]|uniref:Metallo-dependent phosphatase-like protein n=1 Tax=Thamnocephalis sphaerospora TaxID=78915 RepID=A0A4P9XQ77_9FUNG|nr:Metallo-dependent phosphatase-like protein [Thamnocephalis sphaerospora]|eukprot:RKP08183.1 Metallo-dependent phosphatase-like protein [Thamnocephalis sphaerospora]